MHIKISPRLFLSQSQTLCSDGATNARNRFFPVAVLILWNCICIIHDFFEFVKTFAAVDFGFAILFDDLLRKPFRSPPVGDQLPQTNGFLRFKVE